MVKDIYTIELDEGNEHLVALETENDAFETYDEALNFSKMLTSYIKRTAPKKNYNCVGIISSAHHPIGFGEKVFDKKTGEITHPSNLPDFKEPKEHRVYVLLVAHPASDLKKHISDYCRKKGKTMNFNLKELRKSKNISQLRLAIDLNMNQNSISRYENCEREADYETLIKLADYFDVSLDYLLGRYENNDRNN